jgi:hypothetical protein
MIPFCVFTSPLTPFADFSSYLDPLEGVLGNLTSEQEAQLSALWEHNNTPVQKFAQPTLPAQGTRLLFIPSVYV